MSTFALRRGRSERPGRSSDPEGRMPLMEHLRELRRRMVICILALVPGVVLGWIYYDVLVRMLSAPICDIPVAGAPVTSGKCGPLVINGLLGPFNLQVKVALSAGLVIASPVWLGQLWGFVTPGLHRNERRWSAAVIAAGVPLFLAGGALSYWILPRATKLLLGFTPAQIGSLVDFNDYLSIVLRLMLVFGLAFEIPVFVVLLNLTGILSARRLASWWRYIVFGVFLFAAVATPTGDPFTMTALAAPLCVLILLSYLVCRVNDARRGRRDIDYAELDDDETSPLDPTPVDPTRRDDTPSELDDLT